MKDWNLPPGCTQRDIDQAYGPDIDECPICTEDDEECNHTYADMRAELKAQKADRDYDRAEDMAWDRENGYA